MSKFKQKCASKVLDWSQPSFPPSSHNMSKSKKNDSKYLSFCPKSASKVLDWGEPPPPPPPPLENVQIQAEKSALNNLDLGWTEIFLFSPIIRSPFSY